MAQIWSEIYDPKRHKDKMVDRSRLPTIPGEKYWHAPTLQHYQVYFVRVCGFTFEFHSVEQTEACLKYFSRKVRPSSRIRFSDADRKAHWMHWKAQRWFERLPMKLLEERRRARIVSALKQALIKFKNDSHESV
jgi:hypothetical protein